MAHGCRRVRRLQHGLWSLAHMASSIRSGPVIGADLRTPAEGDEAAAGRYRLPGPIDEELQPSLQGVLCSTHDIKAHAQRSTVHG